MMLWSFCPVKWHPQGGSEGVVKPGVLMVLMGLFTLVQLPHGALQAVTLCFCRRFVPKRLSSQGSSVRIFSMVGRVRFARGLPARRSWPRHPQALSLSGHPFASGFLPTKNPYLLSFQSQAWPCIFEGFPLGGEGLETFLVLNRILKKNAVIFIELPLVFRDY